MPLVGTPREYKSLAEDAPLLIQHVVEGVGDVVQDADQLGLHPLLHLLTPLLICRQPIWKVQSRGGQPGEQVNTLIKFCAGKAGANADALSRKPGHQVTAKVV